MYTVIRCGALRRNTSGHETNQGQQEGEDGRCHHSRSSGKNAVAQIKKQRNVSIVTDFCCLWRESGGNKEGTHLSSIVVGVVGVVVGVVMGEILQSYK